MAGSAVAPAAVGPAPPPDLEGSTADGEDGEDGPGGWGLPGLAEAADRAAELAAEATERVSGSCRCAVRARASARPRVVAQCAWLLSGQSLGAAVALQRSYFYGCAVLFPLPCLISIQMRSSVARSAADASDVVDQVRLARKVLAQFATGVRRCAPFQGFKGFRR